MTVKNKLYYTVFGILLVWFVVNLTIAATSNETLSGVIEKIELLHVPGARGTSFDTTVITVALEDGNVIKINSEDTSLSLGDKVTVKSSYSAFRSVKEYKFTRAAVY